MNLRPTFFMAALLGSLVSLQAQAQIIPYANLPSWLVSGSLVLGAAQTNVASSAAREGYLARSWRPNVELQGGVEAYQKGRASGSNPYGGVEAALSLYNGGRDSLEDAKRQAATGVASAKASLTKQELLLAARSAYLEVVFLQEQQALLAAEQTMQKNHQGAAQKRLNANLGTAADTLDFKLRREELAQEETTNRHELAHARQTLATLLGLSNAEALELAALPPLPKVLPQVEVSSSHPAAQAYAQEAASVALAAAQEAAWRRPKVEAYTGYRGVSGLEEAGDLRDRTEGQVGLRLRVPLYDGGNSASEATSLRRQSEALLLEQQAKLNSLKADIAMAQMHWHSLQQKQATIARTLKLAEQLHSQVLKEYRVGNKSSRDMLDATRRLFEARHASLVNRQDQYATLARLEALSAGQISAFPTNKP